MIISFMYFSVLRFYLFLQRGAEYGFAYWLKPAIMNP